MGNRQSADEPRAEAEERSVEPVTDATTKEDNPADDDDGDGFSDVESVAESEAPKPPPPPPRDDPTPTCLAQKLTIVSTKSCRACEEYAKNVAAGTEDVTCVRPPARCCATPPSACVCVC